MKTISREFVDGIKSRHKKVIKAGFYMAADRDGEIYVYSDKPIISGNEWAVPSSGSVICEIRCIPTEVKLDFFRTAEKNFEKLIWRII